MRRLISLLLLLASTVCGQGIPVKNLFGNGPPNANLAFVVGTTYVDQSTSPATVYTCTSVTLTATLSQCAWTSGSGGITSPVLLNQSVDVFNRTASDLGTNWTAQLNTLAPTIAAGVKGGTVSQLNTSAYTAVTNNPTQMVRASILALNGTTDFAGPALRISGTPGTNISYYACNISSSTMNIQRIVGASNASTGVVTTLATVAVTGVAGSFLTFSVVGNTLSCQFGTTSNPILQVNDTSPLASGSPGIGIFGNVATIGSFTFITAGAPVGAAYNIVFDGDSIIAANGNGSNGTDPATSFLYLSSANAYVTNLGVSFKCLGVGCTATSSGTIETMLSTGTSVVDTLLVAGAKNIVVLVGPCTNDIANGARTVAQCTSDITTYVAARKAAGWKVVVSPTLSRGASATNDEKIITVSNFVQANSFAADAIVTLPISLVSMGGFANTTLFNVDQIHPTEITHIDILARAFIAALSKF